MKCRCQIDESETWHMVCGKCWNTVSGGVVDGDDDHPDYRCVHSTLSVLVNAGCDMLLKRGVVMHPAAVQC